MSQKKVHWESMVEAALAYFNTISQHLLGMAEKTKNI
jgi:hypothetical protein